MIPEGRGLRFWALALIVQRSIYPEFVERLAAKAKTLRIGDPADPKTQLGPVISDKQRRRVLSYVEAGLAEGARLVAGGRIPTRPRSTARGSPGDSSSSPPCLRT